MSPDHAKFLDDLLLPQVTWTGFRRPYWQINGIYTEILEDVHVTDIGVVFRKGDRCIFKRIDGLLTFSVEIVHPEGRTSFHIVSRKR